jgi:hypothetical protein
MGNQNLKSKGRHCNCQMKYDKQWPQITTQNLWSNNMNRTNKRMWSRRLKQFLLHWWRPSSTLFKKQWKRKEERICDHMKNNKILHCQPRHSQTTSFCLFPLQNKDSCMTFKKELDLRIIFSIFIVTWSISHSKYINVISKKTTNEYFFMFL